MPFLTEHTWGKTAGNDQAAAHAPLHTFPVLMKICREAGLRSTLAYSLLFTSVNAYDPCGDDNRKKADIMQYNFDQVVDRSHNHFAKYDERVKKFGTDDVIPLWIADMDFKTAQPIIDALKARAEEGIWGYTNRPDSYFEAVKNWQKRRNSWEPDPALMSFSPGVVQTLSVMVQLYPPRAATF